MTKDWRLVLPPSCDDIAELASKAIESLPSQYSPLAKSVVVIVEELPDREDLESLGISDPYELTGLYSGIPLTEKSVQDQPIGPDTIWLFRRPILDEWICRGEIQLHDLVTHILIHELAHHFGWTDQDIAQIDRWWE